MIVVNLTTPMRFARGVFVALLFLSLVAPTMLQTLKISLLAIVVASVLLARETWRTRLSPEQVAFDLWALLYAVVGLAWGVGGLARGNPGAVPMLTVYFVYPLVGILLGRMARPGDLAKISMCLIAATSTVLATQALFIASFFEFDGGIFFRLILGMLGEGTAVVDATDDYLLFTLPNISTLLFMSPWLAVHSVLARQHRAMSAILFFLTVGALLLAGRRASLLALTGGLCAVVFLAPRSIRLSEIALREFVKRLGLLLLVLAGLLVTGFISGVFSTDLLGERLASIFDFSTNESNLERRLQFDALAKDVAERPLVGHGLGAVGLYTRSDEQPWAYELSYVAMMFNFGFLGFSLFAVGAIYLSLRLARLAGLSSVPETDRRSAACFLAGLLAFLIANATNPYLAKFDYMWTIFVPLAFIRLYAIDRLVTANRHRTASCGAG